MNTLWHAESQRTRFTCQPSHYLAIWPQDRHCTAVGLSFSNRKADMIMSASFTKPLKTSWWITILKSPLWFLEGANQQETFRACPCSLPLCSLTGWAVWGLPGGRGGEQEPCTAAQPPHSCFSTPEPVSRHTPKHKLLPPPCGESWNWCANRSHQELIKYRNFKSREIPLPQPRKLQNFGNSFLFHLIYHKRLKTLVLFY